MELILFEYLPKEEQTFKRFKVFLFDKLNKDKEKFRKFTKYPDTFKIPFLLAFLETEGVPIIEALLYYQYKSNVFHAYEYVIKFMIISEFKRIELKKTTNYVPF